MDDKQSLKVC